MNDLPNQPEISDDAFLQIPELPSSERAASDSSASAAKARSEDKALSRNASPDELQKDAAFGEHQRNELFKRHFERIAICALWVAAVALTLVGGIWLWHMAAPACWRWLPTEEVSHLQSILTTGLLVSVAGNHFKRRIG